ncbi:cytochrome c [Candidatus Pantoea multigeneris]|uniref:C-type cytochrome n=1 Tax=Candidatus Pantoea multigeneris TaxID=2608357 RepID=A0ABX0REG7_9GAMM|nr:cytochrome c [Pantoea multigeneris]NIF23746.1 c-type cytochrome [Pantoea multigeneris]
MKRIMNIALMTAGLLLSAHSVMAADSEASASLVKRGEYLAVAGDCSACHRNPQSGKPFSGGFAIQSPMGMIYGSNITPSKTAGIGNYSLADFTAVMREGKAPGNHFLYPAMPYTAFAGMSDDDLHALYSYLMLGVPADDHAAPETSLPFPFSFRPVMFFWNMLYLDKTAVKGSDAPAGSADRGEYLVKTLAHCSTCHTPRDGMMGEESAHFLGGGKVGSWTAPNITPDVHSGIGSWSEDEIVTYLRTGALHGKAIASGEMGTAVQNSFSHLDQSDLQAMAHYLKQVPAISTTDRQAPAQAPQPTPISAVETGMRNTIEDYVSGKEMSGAQLYNGACAACHAADGRGTHDAQTFFPSLVGSSAVVSPDPSNLIMTIAEGVNRNTAEGHAFMPTFKEQFTTEELTKVANYVSVTFGNPAHVITEADVKQTLQGDSGSWLIRYAGVMAWCGIAIAFVLVLWVIFTLRRRRA